MRSITLVILFSIILAGTFCAALFFIPWEGRNWGMMELSSTSQVTVTGEAKSLQTTQIANYSAGVSAVNDNRDTAVSEVNAKVESIINAVKTFGVPPADIKTQNLSVYQNQEQYYEDNRQKLRPGQWNVNNTIEIKLRNVDQASALANVLTQSGATNVYGPSFSFDDTTGFEEALLDEAIKNARSKAEKIAASSGKQLGDVVSVTEGTTAPVGGYPLAMRESGGGGGAAVEPGSGTISKTVTVSFRLR